MRRAVFLFGLALCLALSACGSDTERAPTVDDTWQCIQWQENATENKVTLTIDGVDNPELAVSTNAHGGNQVPFILPTINTVKIGWQLFQANTTPAPFDITPDDIGDEMPLFKTGLGLDSIDALELTLNVEKEYGVKVANSEQALQAFQSVATLADFIEQRRQTVS